MNIDIYFGRKVGRHSYKTSNEAISYTYKPLSLGQLKSLSSLTPMVKWLYGENAQ